MKIPLNWLENYIKLKHSPKEFGDIMTGLEFMQDGPIIMENGQPVIDLEVRQNRPDMLSIIGTAREYGAYINEKVTLPPFIEEYPVEWGNPDKNLRVDAKETVKRFTTVEIKNLKIKNSPKWLTDHLEAYGIPAINNVVDVTNYVMLEFGMPLHAFDVKKLEHSSKQPILILRMAKTGEKFTTWQGNEFLLTNEDLVVADSKKPVAIAGIIGGANSDIDNTTTHIILEGATYNHASIRKSSLRFSIRTDASTRHEKFLNPENVKQAIDRAVFLLQDLAKGEIVKIEDYYENKSQPTLLDFDINEISRIGGVELSIQEVINYLNRLGFDVLEHKEARGLQKNIIVVRVPSWRTDVNIEADLVEEVLRLWGYNNIPLLELSSAPPDYGTPHSIQLEEKVRDILINLGLDEHITNPIISYNDKNINQIKLENPLNKDKNGLRTQLRDSLNDVILNYKKSNIKGGIFEIGKIYIKEKIGKYKETKYVETIYNNIPFVKIKADFERMLIALGIENLEWQEKENKLLYFHNQVEIAQLNKEGYTFNIDNLTEVIKLREIPRQIIKTTHVQTILEELSLLMDKHQLLGQITDIIYDASPLIKKVVCYEVYQGSQILNTQKSATFKLIFEDPSYKLTQKQVDNIKIELIEKLKNKLGVELRK